MDWIERWLSVAPDGGDGTVEALVFGLLLAAAVAGVRRLARRRVARRRAAAHSRRPAPSE